MGDTHTLKQLALLEGTPASVAEAQQRFGFGLGDVTSFLVAIGYHEAKKACLSDDEAQQQEGKALMRALGGVCQGLSEYYLNLGQELYAGQAAEVAGTAFGFAGHDELEKAIAGEWCHRLTGTEDFTRAVLVVSSLEGDMATLAMKMLLKLAKFIELNFDQRWNLVEMMATHRHPDTLGRALWAVETGVDIPRAFQHLSKLVDDDLFDVAKPEQLERFKNQLAQLEAVIEDFKATDTEEAPSD